MATVTTAPLLCVALLARASAPAISLGAAVMPRCDAWFATVLAHRARCRLTTGGGA